MMSERSGIVCAGNWIVDVIHDIPVYPAKSDLVVIANESVGVGGGAANVSFYLAGLQAGYPVLPAGLLGQDEHGDTVLAFCKEAGLNTRYLKRMPEVATARTHVMNVPGDSRTFFYCPGANEHVRADSVPMHEIASQRMRLFYLGYLNLLPQLDAVDANGRTGAADLLASAREEGMVTCVDLVSSLNETYRDTVLGTLPEIDWLFLNEVEAARATGVEISDETDRAAMSEAVTRLFDGGLRQGCILHTPRLSLWKTLDQEIWLDTPQISNADIVSSVGAGDAFAAGLLHGLHEGWTPLACLQLGNQLAAACLRAATATGGVQKLSDL